MPRGLAYLRAKSLRDLSLPMSCGQQSHRRPSYRYRLAPHVRQCWTGDYAILLDLRRGEYFGVSCEDALVLANSVGDFLPSLSNPSGHHAYLAPSEMQLIAELIDKGLLTTDCCLRNRTPSQQHWPPRRELIREYEKVTPQTKSGHLLRFMFAAVTAKCLLRWRTLEYAVARSHRRRLRALVASESSDDQGQLQWELEQLRQHVSSFRRFAPLFLNSINACLLLSFVLIEYLATYRLYPAWIFGVTTAPFAAHCWVQHHDTVLNDSPEFVSQFQSILIA